MPLSSPTSAATDVVHAPPAITTSRATIWSIGGAASCLQSTPSVRAGEVGQVEERVGQPAHRLGREDARAGVGGASRIATVVHRHAMPVTRELVRARGADETATDHRNVDPVAHGAFVPGRGPA